MSRDSHGAKGVGRAFLIDTSRVVTLHGEEHYRLLLVERHGTEIRLRDGSTLEHRDDQLFLLADELPSEVVENGSFRTLPTEIADFTNIGAVPWLEIPDSAAPDRKRRPQLPWARAVDNPDAWRRLLVAEPWEPEEPPSAGLVASLEHVLGAMIEVRTWECLEPHQVYCVLEEVRHRAAEAALPDIARRAVEAMDPSGLFYLDSVIQHLQEQFRLGTVDRTTAERWEQHVLAYRSTRDSLYDQSSALAELGARRMSVGNIERGLELWRSAKDPSRIDAWLRLEADSMASLGRDSEDEAEVQDGVWMAGLIEDPGIRAETLAELRQYM